jgi:hypothetical protein
MQNQKLCHCLIQLECWSVTLVSLYYIQSFVFVFEFTSAEKCLHNICSWEGHKIVFLVLPVQIILKQATKYKFPYK